MDIRRKRYTTRHRASPAGLDRDTARSKDNSAAESPASDGFLEVPRGVSDAEKLNWEDIMPSMKYVSLKYVSELRMTDATCLFQAQRYDGAIYLCGYAIEMALKARICKLHKWDALSPKNSKFKIAIQSHNFVELLELAGLQKELEEAPEYVKTSWKSMLEWSPELRYEVKNRKQPQAGRLFSSSLNVFKWIKEYW